MSENTLIILRGVSGAGKSTVAKLLAEERWPIYEADMFHYDDQGNYNWDAKNMGAAHAWCLNNVEWAMRCSIERIVVSNTSTTEKELNPYVALAEEFGYRVVSLVTENRHGNDSIHSVPQPVRDAQEHRLRNSLKLQ